MEEVIVADNSKDMSNLELMDMILITASDETEDASWKIVLQKALERTDKAKKTVILVTESRAVIRNAEEIFEINRRNDLKHLFFLNEKPFVQNDVHNNVFYSILAGPILHKPIFACVGNYSSGISRVVEKVVTEHDYISVVNLSKKVPLVLLKNGNTQYIVNRPRRVEIDRLLQARELPKVDLQADDDDVQRLLNESLDGDFDSGPNEELNGSKLVDAAEEKE